VTQILFSYWSDFDETWHSYSQCDWALLKRFSKSKVKVTARLNAPFLQKDSHQLAATICCASSGHIPTDGVALRLTVLVFIYLFIDLFSHQVFGAVWQTKLVM